MASHWLFLVTFQIVYEFPSLSGIVGFISEWHTGWWEHFTNILKQLLRNSVVHRKYHPQLHCMYSVITEAGVQLCRFHRIQAWNRHFAQHENKDTLLQMCVAIHCNTFAYITIRVTSSKSVAFNSQSWQTLHQRFCGNCSKNTINTFSLHWTLLPQCSVHYRVMLCIRGTSHGPVSVCHKSVLY